MTPRRARRRPIVARILDALVEQPAPRRMHHEPVPVVAQLTQRLADDDWPLPNPADWARVDLAWGPAQAEALR